MKMRCIRAGFGITLLFNLLLLSINAWGTPYIAFTSERDGDAEIYIMDTKGKNLQNLTNHPARDVQPAFSPDGQWMAYVSDRDGNSRIYLMNRNKNEIRPLTNHLASEADLDPDWSPDGQWIAFTFIQAGIPTSTYNIYKIDVNSGTLQQLTDTEYNRDPAWSPDGDRIIFYSGGKERHDLYVVKSNGKGLRRVILREPGDTVLPGRRMENRLPMSVWILRGKAFIS